jgi:AraC-like DNA-binding protein
MTVAAELLKSTRLNVTDIYMQLGYDDGATFCRPFREQFGVSPLTLRGSSYDFVSRMVAPLRLD